MKRLATVLAALLFLSSAAYAQDRIIPKTFARLMRLTLLGAFFS